MIGALLLVVGSNAQAPASEIAVGYVSLTTTQLAKVEGQAERFAPDLLVRFAKADGSGGTLVMTDRSGTAVVPLESGTYCASAYGLDGKGVAVSARSQEQSHRCFTIAAGKTIEFSITLEASASYSKSIPPLAVQ